MLFGELLELQINDQDEHIATTWEIATDKAFTNIIASSLDDTVNKLRIVFDKLTPEPGREYYGRARVRTRNRGWGNYKNIDIIEVEKEDSIESLYVLPSRIGVPSISTSCSDYQNHSLVDFTISVTGYSVLSEAKHTATSWYIEDIERNIIWKSEYNMQNLNSIDIYNVTLNTNTIYRFRACFHSETNDISDCSALTIKTISDKNIVLKIWLENKLVSSVTDYTQAIEFNYPFEEDMTDVYIQILKMNSVANSTVFNTHLDKSNSVLRIGAGVLENDCCYMVKYRTSTNDEWEVLMFSTYQ